MDSLLVSIVIPNHNGDDFLVECIDSVLAQTYRNFEMIIVDDGSTDQSRPIIEKYCQQDKRIKVILNEPSGIGATRNAGINSSKGDLIAFLDSDDVWHPSKLELQVNALAKNPAYYGCYTAFKVWKDDANGQFKKAEEVFGVQGLEGCIDEAFSGYIYHLLLLDVYVWTSTFIVKREVFDSVGVFDTGLTKGQDYDLWLRIANSHKLLKLEECTALYRQRTSSITKSPNSVNFQAKVIELNIERFGTKSQDGSCLEKEVLNERLALIWYHHACLCYKHAMFDSATKSFKMSLSYKFSLKNFVYMTTSSFKSLLSKTKKSNK